MEVLVLGGGIHSPRVLLFVNVELKVLMTLKVLFRIGVGIDTPLSVKL